MVNTGVPLKTAVDASIFDEATDDSHQVRELLTTLRALCAVTVQSQEALDALKNAVSKVFADLDQSERTSDLRDDLDEELQEIEEDLQFRLSERGRFIETCNEVVHSLYALIRQDPKFSDVYAGAHSKEKAFVITGSLSSLEDLERLAGILKSQDFMPVRVDLRIRH